MSFAPLQQSTAHTVQYSAVIDKWKFYTAYNNATVPKEILSGSEVGSRQLAKPLFTSRLLGILYYPRYDTSGIVYCTLLYSGSCVLLHGMFQPRTVYFFS